MKTWLIGCSSGLGLGIAKAVLRRGDWAAVTALRPDAPFRLLLGSGAVRAAEDTLEKRLQEVRTWAETSRRSDFDAGAGHAEAQKG